MFENSSWKTRLDVGRNVVIGGVYQSLVQVNQQHQLPVSQQALAILTAQALSLLLTDLH